MWGISSLFIALLLTPIGTNSLLLKQLVYKLCGYPIREIPVGSFADTAIRTSTTSPMTRTHLRHIRNQRVYSKMPKFSAEEQAELDRILAGEQIDFTANIPLRKTKAKGPTPEPTSPAARAGEGKTVKSKAGPVMKPNTEWRTALSDPKAPVPVRKPAKQSPSSRFDDMFSADDDSIEFDYDDMFEAMQEMESSGKSLSMGRSSKSSMPTMRPGLAAGRRTPLM